MRPVVHTLQGAQYVVAHHGGALPSTGKSRTQSCTLLLIICRNCSS
jgi:hypothetical protein